MLLLLSAIILTAAYLLYRCAVEDTFVDALQGEPFIPDTEFYRTFEFLLQQSAEQQLSEQLKSVYNNPFIKGVAVIDNDGALRHAYPKQEARATIFLELAALARQRRAVIKHYDEASDSLYSIAPLRLPGDALGGLVIEYDLPKLTQVLHKKPPQAWYFSVGAILLTVLLASMFLYCFISCRINRLQEVVDQLTRGKLDAKAITGNDEIGRLGAKLNTLSARLQQTSAEQKENAKRLQGVVDHSPSIIYLKDLEGRFLLANEKCREHIGAAEVIGFTQAELGADQVLKVFAEYENRLKFSGHTHQMQLEVFKERGSEAFLFTLFPLFDNEEKHYAICVIATDISNIRANEKALEVARNIFETTNEGIVVTNKDNLIVDVNHAFESITGYSKGEALGRNPSVLTSNRHSKEFFEDMWKCIQSQGSWSGEIWNRRKSGEIYPQWLAIKSLEEKGGEPSGYFGVFTDITLQKQTEKELRSLAYYDPLTQLANRALLKDRLQHDINFAKREKRKLALFFLDLDRFKQINDTMGHDQGDKLLIQVAKRIMAAVRSTDTVARLAGDEFVVVLPGILDQHKVDVFGNKLLALFDQPFELDGKQASVGVSCGISIYPEDGQTIEDLMRNADAAMYKAKEQGRGRKVYFDQSINVQLVTKMKLRQSLTRALENNEFEMHYQSIVNLKNDNIEGAEALIRWKLPNGKMVPPNEFIQAAEEMDMIIPIGDWVLLAVCGQVKKIRDEGRFSHRVAINLSPKQLKQKGFVEKVRRILNETKTQAEWFAFEVTETTVIEDVQHTVQILQQLKEMGFTIELDDFGTGYSSLEHIKRLPIDIVKIDRSFINDLNDSEKSMSIVGNVINMAHSQDNIVVAEGVETAQQFNLLKFLGCDMVQGYYFHRPEPFEDWLVSLYEHERSKGTSE